MVQQSFECERCKAWKNVLSVTLGSTATKILESMVEKELASSKPDQPKQKKNERKVFLRHHKFERTR